jgi:hypothetical protein
MKFIKEKDSFFLNESVEHELLSLNRYRKLTFNNPYYFDISDILTNSDDIKRYTIVYDEEDLSNLKYFFFFKGPHEAGTLKTSEFVTGITEIEGVDYIVSFSPNIIRCDITKIKDENDYEKLLIDYIDEIDEMEFKSYKEYIASTPINMDDVKKEDENAKWKMDDFIVDMTFKDKVIGFFETKKILCNISKRNDSKFWLLILRNIKGHDAFIKRAYLEVIYLAKDIEALGLKEEVKKNKQLQERIDKELKNA